MHCGICNYNDQDGSDLLDKPPSKYNHVKWSNKYRGFICTDCVEAIKSAVWDYKTTPNEWKWENQESLFEEKEVAGT